jgi:nicotinamidase-related amidase
VTQVVLAGVATSSGVEATARNAYDHGYNAELRKDRLDAVPMRVGGEVGHCVYHQREATTDDVIRSLADPRC